MTKAIAQDNEAHTAFDDLTRAEYESIRRLVYAQSGINLGDSKMQLVRARLGKRLRRGGFRTYRDYVRHVESDSSGTALGDMLDAISTNTTHLFREMRHFTRLREIVRGWAGDPAWRRRHPTLRLWSAGCSSGEEPHSIAMVVHDVLRSCPGVEIKILATDLSVQMLSRARAGLYELQRVGTVPVELRNRYLHKVNIDGRLMWQLVPELCDLIRVGRLNLMSPHYPFRHGFDVIFCRNVMIYFDGATKQALVNKLAAQLHDGGYFFIGHSESLNGMSQPLTYVEPTVYRK